MTAAQKLQRIRVQNYKQLQVKGLLGDKDQTKLQKINLKWQGSILCICVHKRKVMERDEVWTNWAIFISCFSNYAFIPIGECPGRFISLQILEKKVSILKYQIYNGGSNKIDMRFYKRKPET